VAGLIESRLKYQHSDNCKPKLIFSKSGATNNATSHSLWLSQDTDALMARERRTKLTRNLAL